MLPAKLLENDIDVLDAVLANLLQQTGAIAILLIDTDGTLIKHRGDVSPFDITAIAAMTSGTFMADRIVAQLVHAKDPGSVSFRAGELNVIALPVTYKHLLAIVFRAGRNAGLMKNLAMEVVGNLTLHGDASGRLSWNDVNRGQVSCEGRAERGIIQCGPRLPSKPIANCANPPGVWRPAPTESFPLKPAILMQPAPRH